MFGLTADAVGVVVRSAQEVRQRHQQRGQAGQQSSASDEPRPVDSTPEETHEDDEDRVSHLHTHTESRALQENRGVCVGKNLEIRMVIQEFNILNIKFNLRNCRSMKNTHICSELLLFLPPVSACFSHYVENPKLHFAGLHYNIRWRETSEEWTERQQA